MLLHRHNVFISQYLSTIDELTEQAWLQQKYGLTTHIAEKDKNLRLRSQRLWLAIGNGDHQFNMQQRLLDSLNALTLEDVKAYAAEIFNADRPRYELLSAKSVNQPKNLPLYSHSL
mgnify:FL=1